MTQLGHKVTPQAIREYCNYSYDRYEDLDVECGLYIGATHSYVQGNTPGTPMLFEKYFAYQGNKVDIVEVTPVAIICN